MECGSGIIMRMVEVYSNQYSAKGMLHFYSPPYAFVELDDGELRKYDLTSCYSMKFID